MWRVVLILSVLVGRSLFAEVALIEKTESEIVVGQRFGKPWKNGEEACVVRKHQKVGCGTITDSNVTAARIILGDAALDVEEGDRVQTYREIYEESQPTAHLTAGVEAGFGYWFPTLEVQFNAFQDWKLGILASLSNSSTSGVSIKSKALMVSLNHYAFEKPFPGFWFRGGFGAYQWSVTRNGSLEEKIEPFVLSTVGWRGQWKLLTVGIGLGAQYVPNQIQSAPLGLRDLEPVGTFDLGINF